MTDRRFASRKFLPAAAGELGDKLRAAASMVSMAFDLEQMK